VDVTVLTALNRRKEVHLARALPWLEPWETELRCSLPRPKPVEGPRYLGGRAKHELLARSKVLLGVRTVRPPYFEWVRALEAICNGTVYLCEQGAGQAPLVAGSHVVMAAPEALGPVADALLRDPERLAAIRTAAYELVRAELPMRAGAERLQDVAFALAPVRTASSDASTAPNPSRGAGDRTVDSPLDVLPGPRLPDFEDPAMAPPPGVLPDEDALRVTLRERTLELREARREIARLTLRARGEDPDALDVTTSPDSAGHLPRVSVLLPLYDLAEHVEEALRSVAAQTLEDLELVVCDDASTDGSADVAARVLADLGRPFTLLRRRVNAGLPATRNLLLEHARAPYALPLDADNALFPRAAARLAAALDADPTAAFAYGPIAMERDGEPAGLLSALDWEPGDLRTCNWIDAMALLRVDAVRALGGYVTDDGLHGWEDYDLWCAVAEAGGNGAFVPQPVGRYRRSGGSMLSLSDLDQDGMRARLAARHPGLFADTAESLG
jgi:hypothetical protein